MTCLLAQLKGRAHGHACTAAVQTSEVLSLCPSQQDGLCEEAAERQHCGESLLDKPTYSGKVTHNNPAVAIFHLFLYFLIILTYLILYMRTLILNWITFLK